MCRFLDPKMGLHETFSLQLNSASVLKESPLIIIEKGIGGAADLDPPWLAGALHPTGSVHGVAKKAKFMQLAADKAADTVSSMNPDTDLHWLSIVWHCHLP